MAFIKNTDKVCILGYTCRYTYEHDFHIENSILYFQFCLLGDMETFQHKETIQPS
jgi:hypothetical protein